MRGGGDWLPPDFEPPAAEPVPYGHRLRPARGSDVGRLLVADARLDQERAERRLARWLGEMAARTAYTYVLVDADETAILGRVRIDRDGASWGIVEECRGTDLAAAFDEAVAQWVSRWPAPDGS